MSISDWIIAWLLLTSPDSLQDMAAVHHAMPLIRGPLLTFCATTETIDQRELRGLLVAANEYEADLLAINKMWARLRDCPSAADAERFPDRAAINEQLCLNRSYRKRLEERQLADVLNGPAICGLIQETDLLYRAWDYARDAKCEYYYVWVRREALRNLRELIGPENYARGQMPHYLPIWRFERVDR